MYDDGSVVITPMVMALFSSWTRKCCDREKIYLNGYLSRCVYIINLNYLNLSLV